ncbi:MazG nucleotide pyrophosphohydrolase domain-containing protein [Paenibacillus uliginis N3/975]|uniref:MazG nucleotide pyrophosphohydrolase domain-containing protein n=2 Tax=Paenibacillus TaxID=44249 RepID=A0A1X7HJZ5_9BACL|nr:MazG nucleotide pyrophosphohydrolase domain-containing protein [Paenibacillus uliginis N3/975]
MPEHICFAIPLIDYPVKGYQPGDMRVKLQEEVNELVEEIESANYDQRRMLSELFDVLQVTVGLIRQQAREITSPSEANKVLDDVIKRAYFDHLYKINEYARQRSWEVVQDARM